MIDFLVVMSEEGSYSLKIKSIFVLLLEFLERVDESFKNEKFSEFIDSIIVPLAQIMMKNEEIMHTLMR